MWSNYGQKSLLVAIQSGKGHICSAKPFLLKMGCEIPGWRFLKFWFFYSGFYYIAVRAINRGTPTLTFLLVLCRYQCRQRGTISVSQHKLVSLKR